MLFNEVEALADVAEPQEQEEISYRLAEGKPKRRPQPPELPREERTHDLTEKALGERHSTRGTGLTERCGESIQGAAPHQCPPCPGLARVGIGSGRKRPVA